MTAQDVPLSPARQEGPMGVTIRCGSCLAVVTEAAWRENLGVGDEGRCNTCGAVCARVVADGIEPYGFGERVADAR